MPPTRRKRPTSGGLTKRRSAAAHLLVLECQDQKLNGQGLNFGSRTVPFLKALFPTKRIVLVPTSSLSELGPSLAEPSAKYGRFRSLLIVGHSNAMGLQLTNDHFCSWHAVGQWITKLSRNFFSLLLARPVVPKQCEAFSRLLPLFGKSMPHRFSSTPASPHLLCR